MGAPCVNIYGTAVGRKSCCRDQHLAMWTLHVVILFFWYINSWACHQQMTSFLSGPHRSHLRLFTDKADACPYFQLRSNRKSTAPLTNYYPDAVAIARKFHNDYCATSHNYSKSCSRFPSAFFLAFFSGSVSIENEIGHTRARAPRTLSDKENRTRHSIVNIINLSASILSKQLVCSAWRRGLPAGFLHTLNAVANIHRCAF